MSMERIRLNGLQDRSLEIRRNHSTPTRDSDISGGAKAYKGFIADATFHTMAMEGSTSEETAGIRQQHEEALRAIRHDVVVSGGVLWAFDQIVTDNIALIKKQEEEKQADWKLINQEFPGQFEDWEKQAFMGDVPPRNDAGGFEMKRRGW